MDSAAHHLPFAVSHISATAIPLSEESLQSCSFYLELQRQVHVQLSISVICWHAVAVTFKYVLSILLSGPFTVGEYLCTNFGFT
jgi:hypothetical protein